MCVPWYADYGSKCPLQHHTCPGKGDVQGYGRSLDVMHLCTTTSAVTVGARDWGEHWDSEINLGLDKDRTTQIMQGAEHCPFKQLKPMETQRGWVVR